MKKAFSELNKLLSKVHPLILTLSVLAAVGMNLLANKSVDTGLSWLALDCGQEQARPDYRLPEQPADFRLLPGPVG